MGGEGLRPGGTFAGYRVDRELGSGGMGMVYLVEHPTLGKYFALKVLPENFSRDPEFVSRFSREMRTVSRLEHPHIVSTTNADVTDGRSWYTMTYLRGTDAAHAVKRSPSGLPTEQVVRIVDAVADALDYAHRNGVVHRDVKPANILLGEDGRICLTDFGIAKVIGETASMTAVQPFTADFASPEQVENAAVGEPTDVYSLGATAYALLTGQPPYPGPVPAKLLGHAQQPPPRASVTRPELPAGTDAVIAAAMAKRPEDRFPTCARFAEALRDSLGTGALTRPDPGPPPGPHRTPRPPRRRAIWAIGAVVGLLAGLGIWVGTRMSGPEPTPTTTAAAESEPAATTAATTAATGDDVAVHTSTGVTQAGSTGEPTVVALDGLISPSLPTGSGTSADQPVAGASTVTMGPRSCPNGSQVLDVDVGSGLQRITATFLMSDSADPSTRTHVTVTADGTVVADKTVAPRAGATINADVAGAGNVTIGLATAGSGRCGSDDYSIFLTNAQAFR